LDKYDLWKFPDSIKTPVGWIGYKYDSSFVSFAKIRISAVPKNIIAKEEEKILLNCRFEIPETYSSYIRSHPILNDTTKIGVFNKNGWIKDNYTGFSLHQANEQHEIILQIVPALPPGKYYLLFSINSGYYIPTHNSNKIELLIK